MKIFFEILKVQLLGIFSSQTKIGKKKSMGIFLLGLIFVSIIYCSSLYSFMIYTGLPSGQKFFMLYIMFGVAFILLFVFSISMAQGQLFEFKDFELLMTLPISRMTILVAKILSFYIILFMYELFFIGPVIMIYGVMEKMGLMYYLYAGVGSIFFVLTPITIASVLALIVRKISGTGKYRNLITNVVTFIFFIGIFIGSFSISSNPNMVVSAESLYLILDYLRTFATPAYYFAQACLNSNFIDLCLYIGASVVIFIAFILIFNKMFIKTNSNVTIGYKVKNFKLEEKKVQSQFITLYLKEIKKVLSNFMYIMNMTIGQIMMIGFGIYFVFFANDSVAQFITLVQSLGIDVHDILFGLVLVAICLCGHMSATSSVSISLEGKHLWILQTAPIKTVDIFLSKILVNVTFIIFTSLISLILMGIAFNFNLFYVLLGCLVIIGLSFFVGLFGLIANVNYPKLEFDREIVVIKQSASSFIAIIGGIIIALIICACYAYVVNSNTPIIIFVLGLLAFYFISDIFMWIYLKTTGIKKFLEIY